MNHRKSFKGVLLLLLHFVPVLALGAEAAAAKKLAGAAVNTRVEKRVVSIWSDGTRMAAHLYLPADRPLQHKLPAVVLCAGTGGTKESTGGRIAPLLVQHGFIVLAFDYRGWGESESRLIAVAPQPKPDARQEMTITVKALRGQMSYAEQTEDIRAALSYLSGEEGVDPARVGLWGTSYGGGLAVWVAGNDPRVRCVVVQVPGMGPGSGPAAMKRVYDLATQQARGITEPVPVVTGRLTGQMARYTEMRRNPVKSLAFNVAEAAAKINVPVLFVVAENEELGGNEASARVHRDLVQRGVTSSYHVVKGITHYGVYREGFEESSRVELEWFDRHLKR